MCAGRTMGGNRRRRAAALLPLSDLTGARKQWKAFLEKNRDKELILYCASGYRAGRAAQLLAGEGFRTANTGGFGDWQAAGLPVRKPKNPHARRRSGLVDSDPVSTPWMPVFGTSATLGMILCTEPSRTVFW